MIILIIVLVGIIEKKPIFDLFIKGAIKGIENVVTNSIIPELFNNPIAKNNPINVGKIFCWNSVYKIDNTYN